MKKTVMSTLLLSTLVLGGAQAFAAEAPTTPTDIQTEGTISFEDGGTDPEGPEGPEITDPNKPDPDPGEKPEKPGDKPGGQVNPNQGPLRLVYAPNFNFETQKVTTKEMTYNALPATYGEKGNETYKPLFAQVNDLRVKEIGKDLTEWSLSLSASEFKGYEVKTGEDGQTVEVAVDGEDGKLAAGAKLMLNNIMLVNANDEDQATTFAEGGLEVGLDGKPVTIADKGQRGLSVVRFGEKGEKQPGEYDGVQLVVPGKVSQSSVQGVKYKTNLTWNLKAGEVTKSAQGTPTV